MGGGGRENWLVKIAWIRACVTPDCWISKNASQNKEWEIMVSACLVLLVLARGGKTSSVFTW